ncbi:MAG: heme ABC transporter ATP-binding protein [Cohaesibacter sp.]|nr:heme ABC transporter ATP-binding protein [Cohaesibacter sp.]
MTTEIILENVSLTLGSKRILKPLDLSLRSSDLTILVGPNGAGKSSLLKLICGDHQPDQGRILFDQIALPHWPLDKLARRRAVMAQSSQIAFPFTVLEVVRMGANLQSVDAYDADRRAMLALEAVDMERLAGQRFQALSGGEQQRVQLARTLAQVWSPCHEGQANFLLLDEPISNLDIRHQIELLQLAKDYTRSGGGCLAVLHDLNIASMFADRLLVMQQGQIVGDGPPNETLTNDLIAQIFGIRLQVNRPPGCPIPYILPQTFFDAADPQYMSNPS